ncbi:hypothetical protein Y032_0032g2588 [Ancylostoma ceylanicum]|uniref:Reverse transcriptase domain-containing protein n=1 Tax=Ancylostoma ceylanicum TaxID=53326 RepID=A0A016UP42_9BILA|nr:hypothetical protein Y032_0032g2588 [Ancylostoma ceylanicum]
MRKPYDFPCLSCNTVLACNVGTAFDTVETEAVLEALGNQGVPTQYIRIFRELYNNFTTRISPFYDDITIDVRRGVRQGDTVSPKLFTATLEDVMRRLEWDNMGVRVDGRLLHHLRFADDIVLITPSISQAERMLADFDDACGKIGLQLNLTKTMFMRNGWVPDAPFSLNGTAISECSSYVYLGREVNMMNDLAPELGRRKRAAWRAYKSIEDVVKKTKNIRLRAHLFNTTVLPALTYVSETWAIQLSSTSSKQTFGPSDVVGRRLKWRRAISLALSPWQRQYTAASASSLVSAITSRLGLVLNLMDIKLSLFRSCTTST